MGTVEGLLEVVEGGRNLFTPSDHDFLVWEPLIRVAETKGLVRVKRQESKRRGENLPVYLQVKIVG